MKNTLGTAKNTEYGKAAGKPRAYNLVLQHCPPELETRPTTEPKWDQVRMNQGVVGLLGMIQDIAHNHDETKLGLMAIIESDMELYLGFQRPTEPGDDYMAIFNARVDTINAQEGLAGKHPGHVNDTFAQTSEE